MLAKDMKQCNQGECVVKERYPGVWKCITCDRELIPIEKQPEI